MNVLIATPAFGGQVTTHYIHSLLSTTIGLQRDGIKFVLYTPDRESLIPRGRNECARAALEGKFTDLFFIDADLGWTYPQFKKVLLSKRPICGGTYPVKDYPLTYNFDPFNEDKSRALVDGPMNQINFKKFKETCADLNGEVRVAHLPTGFMRIQTKVLKHLLVRNPEANGIPRYYTRDRIHGHRLLNYEFFRCGSRGEDYLSEDWFFCEHAIYEGHFPYLQTQAVCSHTGSHTYGQI